MTIVNVILVLSWESNVNGGDESIVQWNFRTQQLTQVKSGKHQFKHLIFMESQIVWLEA